MGPEKRPRILYLLKPVPVDSHEVMDKDIIKEKVRSFLLQKIKNPHLADEEDFFQKGFVNSLFAMQLVLFVEQEFHFQIGDEDLAIENFNSINAIVGLILRRRQANS